VNLIVSTKRTLACSMLGVLALSGAGCSGRVNIGDVDGGAGEDARPSVTASASSRSSTVSSAGVCAPGESCGGSATATASSKVTAGADASTTPVDATASVDASCPTTGTDSLTIPASSLQFYSEYAGAYTGGLDSTTQLDGVPTMLLASTAGATGSTYATESSFNGVPESAIGKRYRVRAQLKTNNAQAAYLWFSVYTQTVQVLANGINPTFEAIVGTNDWQPVEQVLDVPAGAQGFSFGSILSGTGEVWVGPITLEEVAECVPLSESGSYALPDGGATGVGVDGG
jgi:hypothetical protein